MVDFELSDGVTFIRVNRPEGTNAGSSVVLDGLDEAFVRVSHEAGVRACVLSGAEKYESSAADEAGAREEAVRCQEVCDRIERCPVPVIAAVDNLAAGCGCELVLACHLRIASTRAGFRGPVRLCAEEAHRAGLVSRLVAPEQLMAEAEALARTIAGLAPLAIRACLEAVTRGSELPLAEGLALEARLFSGLFSTEDVREGTRAFIEKRAPVFKGK